jgi:hypothetical protein
MFMYASNDFSVNFHGADRRFNSPLAYLNPKPGFWQAKNCSQIADGRRINYFTVRLFPIRNRDSQEFRRKEALQSATM